MSAWISRARVSAYAATFTEQAITDLFGLGDAGSPPIAPLSYLQDFGRPPAASCLRADPVHLRADTNGLVLFDAASFELDQDDSRALLETLAEHLAADGWRLQQSHPQRWYLVGEQPLDLVTTALPRRRGTPVSTTHFAGKDATFWTNRLNEMQMLLHSHPVNQARALRGQVAINSIWLWGAGELQPPGEPRYTRLSADNACALGAARWCTVPASNIEPAADRFLPGLRLHERVLLVLENCRAAAAYEDFGAWEAAVRALEEDWLVPLVQALRTGRIDRLELLPLNGRRYRLERRDLRSFWKRIRDYPGEHGFRRSDATRV